MRGLESESSSELQAQEKRRTPTKKKLVFSISKVYRKQFWLGEPQETSPTRSQSG